jgi:hypothetical protein
MEKKKTLEISTVNTESGSLYYGRTPMCTTLFSKSKHVIQSQFLNLLEVSAILGFKVTKFGFLRTQKLKDIKAFCK